MATDLNRELTVTLTHEVWDHLLDRLGDYADDAEERPWLGDCFGCDRAEPGMCPKHQEEAEYGGQVRAWRDEIVDQLAAQTTTTADLVRYSLRPVKTNVSDLPGVSVALVNTLARAGIFTLRDLAKLSEEEVRGIRDLGAGRRAELRAALRKSAHDQ
ncbi:RNA polymerase alpha subunit [Nonomuraea fuscirosea]|uniref:RNA polymerase alpha subunit n=1 Tax=Nonomuraea fuscirosea TaxID=1291556 RepID=A0A2T0N2H5_9ACTN|nr:DNA-directed RNA polymerase subunit alpha C-terminal domain-containing protein [Nonomuraea fuscirosea]PRX66183.1 RNA polymerase alpha subunit [Nonomuraea fuscirosea]